MAVVITLLPHCLQWRIFLTLNMKETDTDQLPCTSKPCTWNVPKKRKQEPSTIQGVHFQKHVYGKESKAPRAPTPPVAVSQSANDFLINF